MGILKEKKLLLSLNHLGTAVYALLLGDSSHTLNKSNRETLYSLLFNASFTKFISTRNSFLTSIKKGQHPIENTLGKAALIFSWFHKAASVSDSAGIRDAQDQPRPGTTKITETTVTQREVERKFIGQVLKQKKSEVSGQ